MNSPQPTALPAKAAPRLRLGPLRHGGLLGVIIVTLGYLALSIPRMGDLYVIDEAVFPYVADGILKNGAPFYYNGELRPADFGLWHPPLYDYLLAGFVGVFGFSPVSVRAFGLVCVIASMYVLFLVLRRIMPNAPQLAYVTLAALVLLSPQIISGALVPDIDGSFGVLVVVLGLWLATAVKQDALSVRMLLLLVAFATLTVATKFTISGFVALIIGVAALLSSSQRWIKAIAVVGSFAAGTLLSLALLVITGALIGFDARLPFDYLFESLSSRTPGRGGVSGAIATLFEGPGATLVWIGPALLVAAMVAAVAIPVLRVPAVDARLVVLSAASGVVILIGYAFISASPFQFPKYTPIAVPALALAATTLVSLVPRRAFEGLRSAPGRIIGGLHIIVIFGGAIGMFFLATRNEKIHGRTLADLAFLSLWCFVAVTIVTVAALLLVRLNSRERPKISIASIVASGAVIALLLTPVMAQVTAAAVNVLSPYATRYYYGERGMDRFVREAEQLVPGGTQIIGPKDIGFQIDRRFYEDALLFASPVDEFRSFVEDERIPFVVTRKKHDYSEAVYPEYFDVVREYYEPVIDSPDMDFVLWKLKAGA
ncbi:MAG TPA: hypothetical protein DEA69_08090 [Microbacterium sp.]|nr:hypothetical protein [Microbacterium sp.]HBS08747.1 hypothetical protein [Microbacterium sp.]HBU43107.1 hypothetical protein [Microbacterium sp.]